MLAAPGAGSIRFWRWEHDATRWRGGTLASEQFISRDGPCASGAVNGFGELDALSLQQEQSIVRIVLRTLGGSVRIAAMTTWSTVRGSLAG